MTNAGQQVLPASAGIGKVLQPLDRIVAEIELMTAAGIRAKKVHNLPPLAAMRSYRSAVQVESDQMGYLVRWGLLEKDLAVLFQQQPVVANVGCCTSWKYRQSRRPAAEVETHAAERYFSGIVHLGQLQKLAGLLDGLLDQPIAGGAFARICRVSHCRSIQAGHSRAYKTRQAVFLGHAECMPRRTNLKQYPH